MTMMASEIGTVPSAGFKWYMFFLEGPFGDEIKEQIDKHFLTLGREAGPDVLVVRGYEPTKFSKSFEAESFYGEGEWKSFPTPALVVTNGVPGSVGNRGGLDEKKVLVFPLADIYEKSEHDIVPFFERLLSALSQSDAMAALDAFEESRLEKYWGWLDKYVDLDIKVFGFGVDLKALIRDHVVKPLSR